MRREFACLGMIVAGAVGLALSAFAQPGRAAPDPSHPGRAVYVARCASCHENPGATRAATFGQITGTPARRLRATLSESGIMAPMAAGLSSEDLDSLVGYLTSGQQTDGRWIEALMCAPNNRTVDTRPRAAFPGFGVDPRSTRSLTAKQAGLTKAELTKVEVAWAVGFPQTQSLGTGVAVMGDTAYVNAAGRLLAMDADRGCVRWAKAYASSNTPQIGEVGGRKVLAFSVDRGDVVLLDAGSGEEIWKAAGRPANGAGNIRGGVVLYRDKVIVPISASGVGAGMNPRFECCVGHGAVVALSARDGARLWEYHTMPDAAYTGKVSRTGVRQRGPSGAPIWAMPTIDAKRNRVIVATGENTSHPGTETSDAIIALDLETGRPAWVFQATKADVWNLACDDIDLQKSGPNCPNLYDNDKGRDFDFGATPVLVTVGGKDIVLNGQKSGQVWALDADNGKLRWQDRVGEGTALGGVHWGVTTDGERLFAPIADSDFGPDQQNRNKAGVYAWRILDGRRAWSFVAKPDCSATRAANVVGCHSKYGYSAAALTVDGAIIAGSLDGKVTILDGKTGQILRVVDTARPVKTLNGVLGKGGSIDAHALSAGHGTVFVMSGYGSFGQTPGNVLIALRPER